MNRVLKQIFIAIVSLSLLGGIIYFGAKLILPADAPEPPPVEHSKENISVLWTKILSAGNSGYNLVAQIENPNINFGASYFDYEFILYDKNNIEITKKMGKGYIMPRERKYILEMFVDASQSPSKVVLNISGVKWQESKDNARLNVTKVVYSDLKFEIAGAYSEVTGIIANQSSYNYNEVAVNIVLYDQSGNVVSVNKTGINTLLSQEERSFRALWYAPLAVKIGKIDISAATNLYNTDNLLQEKGTDGDLLRE